MDVDIDIYTLHTPFPVICMGRVCSLHQEGSACDTALPTTLNAIRGPQSGQGSVGSVSDLLKGMSVGSIESPSMGWATMALAQLQHLPH